MPSIFALQIQHRSWKCQSNHFQDGSVPFFFHSSIIMTKYNQKVDKKVIILANGKLFALSQLLFIFWLWVCVCVCVSSSIFYDFKCSHLYTKAFVVKILFNLTLLVLVWLQSLDGCFFFNKLPCFVHCKGRRKFRRRSKTETCALFKYLQINLSIHMYM